MHSQTCAVTLSQCAQSCGIAAEQPLTILSVNIISSTGEISDFIDFQYSLTYPLDYGSLGTFEWLSSKVCSNPYDGYPTQPEI